MGPFFRQKHFYSCPAGFRALTGVRCLIFIHIGVIGQREGKSFPRLPFRTCGGKETFEVYVTVFAEQGGPDRPGQVRMLGNDHLFTEDRLHGLRELVVKRDTAYRRDGAFELPSFY